MSLEKKQIAKNIQDKIKEANNILIISSRPADPDCIASNLSLRWWIENYFEGKTVKSVIFGAITDRLYDFPEIEKVEFTHINEVDFNQYDLCITVDGSHWNRVFTESTYEDTLKRIDFDKFVGIDHHTPGDILDDLRERFLQEFASSCTKVIYDYFIKSSGIEIPDFVATWIYYGLIDDTGRFTHEMKNDTYLFANELFNLGADHARAVDQNIPVEQLLFASWAINNLKFFDDIKTMALIIDYEQFNELTGMFGRNWERKILGHFFVEAVMKRVIGYDYGVFFQPDIRTGGVRGGWRTRNYGEHIEMKKVFEQLGFEAGGHFGAGGGFSNKLNIDEVEDKFVQVMKEELKKL